MANILIAEDDAGVRHLVSRGLGLDGHSITTAEDGEQALTLLHEGRDRFDFVLSDIRMPMLTGIELAHAIARHWPELPVLLMTGYADQKEAADDLMAVIEGVVEKPFTLAEIRRAVGAALAARKGRATDDDAIATDISLARVGGHA